MKPRDERWKCLFWGLFGLFFLWIFFLILGYTLFGLASWWVVVCHRRLIPFYATLLGKCEVWYFFFLWVELGDEYTLMMLSFSNDFFLSSSSCI